MPLFSLWIPVVVSAVAVFIISSLIHMVLRYHKSDHKVLPDEDAVRAALSKGDPAPGQYFTPYCSSMKAMGEPANLEKFQKGPVAHITVLPKGMPAMPKLLGLWFLYTLLVSFVAAYVARHTLTPGADGILVMQITGTVAFAAYGLGVLDESIWKGQPWVNTARFLVDAILYSTATGVCFMLLWPSA